MDAAKAGPKGIAGWLLLPALGLVFSPILMAFDIYQQVVLLTSDGVQKMFNDPGSRLYHPMWNAYALGTGLLNAALLAATVYVSWRFFTKSPQLPRLYIVWLLALVGVQVADIAVLKLGGFPVPNVPDGVLSQLIRSAVTALIWIPYFLVSKRVRNTFVAAPEPAMPIERREPTTGPE